MNEWTPIILICLVRVTDRQKNACVDELIRIGSWSKSFRIFLDIGIDFD